MQNLERWILFPGSLLGAPLGARRALDGVEPVWITTDEGQVEAWFLPATDGPTDRRRPAVLFAHGNGERIDDWPQVLEPYRRMGVGVFLPEYRGYGRSKGTPSEKAIVDDYVRFYDWLRDREEIDPDRIVFHGRSLGGGVVCDLSLRRPCAGMILESTFTSVPDVARRWRVPGNMIRNRFDNRAAVREFAHPILVFHGTRDRVIPHLHGVELAHDAKQAKLVSYDCDHNDLPRKPDAFWAEIEHYLKDTLGFPVG